MNQRDATKDITAPSRPTRLTREQSRAQTRERLLASAAVVFAREGYAGASVDRIAEEAGYSKGALYSNFASKDELFFELFDYYAGGQADELCRRLDAVADAEEAIATVCTWANGLQHEPDLRLLVLDLTRLVRNHTVLFERHTRLFDEQWKAVGSRLAKIFPDGRSPVAPLVLGALVMELTYGNAMQLHAELRAGDLIGLALRALHDAHRAST
ncbi:TetR/AcrR family transcriptional regulator [Massilia brevitalea]|uniref:TetR/AcrR family transcriptional regulator n=1 Tax=Massilia brevitalea TaxID=442526 RepID=UPI0027382AB3|nr:TetR/AcrR family transcriptional regulator [Massilia brevitalea]